MEAIGLHTPILNVRGARAFCGPTAMSAITGIPVSECIDAVRQARGDIRGADGRRMPVMGVSNNHLVQAMEVLGWKGLRFTPPERLRLGEWIAKLGAPNPSIKWIVNVTGHYIAFGGGEFCDTRCPLPLPIEKCPRRGRWVQHWFRFDQAA